MTALPSLWRAAFAEAWGNRSSFWVQVSAMMANDLAWVVFWLLFFRKVGSLRGWDVHQILLLFAILTSVSGISLGLLGNSRRLGRLIADGEIDAVLSLPVDPLAYLLVRRVDTALLGDLAFGPILLVVAGSPTLERAATYVLGVLCGSAVMVSFLVILGSLSLFGGGRGETADLGFQAILILASYPLDVFGGLTKLVLFTVLPAAFVSGLPTRLVSRFQLSTAGALVGVAALMAALAWLTFRTGLRRYRSGALWTRA